MRDLAVPRTLLTLRLSSVTILVDVVVVVVSVVEDSAVVTVDSVEILDLGVLAEMKAKMVITTMLLLNRLMDLQLGRMVHQEDVDVVTSVEVTVAQEEEVLLNHAFLFPMFLMNVTSPPLVHSILITMLVYAIICALQCLYIDIYFASK